ncbi:MAG: hypothetical protein ACLGSD_13270 [Acidobacteriota bacterium]
MTNGKSRLPKDTEADSAKPTSSVPPAMLQENKPTSIHNRSHAAHLEQGRGEPHSKPVGELRQVSYPNGRKQP